MTNSVVLIGIGEMGGVFARGLLKAGHTVYPVMRGADLDQVIKDNLEPTAVVIAVGEKDIQDVLAKMPDAWHDKLVLLQNELLPGDWQKHHIKNPTVISVWFEKKAGQDVKEIIPSPVYGPRADLIRSSLKTIDVFCRVLADADDLVFELVLKNLYILTVNISGLITGGTVGDLWNNHQPLARDVAGDVLDVQFALIGKELDRERLINGLVKAFEGDMDHKCMGRSAPTRLARAIAMADQHNIEAKKLREIQALTSQSSAA